MSIEHLGEAERKKLILTEGEQKEEIRRSIEHRKETEKLLGRIEKEKKLSFLKSLIERGLIRIDTVEQVLDSEGLDVDVIADIFEKIDVIESTHDVDRIFPEQFRVSKEEYLLALRSIPECTKLIAKIDASLVFIHDSLHPNAFSILDFFSAFMMILDRNLVGIQEHTIDIKRSLK